MRTYYYSIFFGLGSIFTSCQQDDQDRGMPITTEVVECSRIDEESNAKTYISFEYKAEDYYNIDHAIRISKLAPEMSWVANIYFEDEATIGYIGFQSDANLKTQIVFAMENALTCEAFDTAICKENLEEGIQQIQLDYPVKLGDEYRIRIWRITSSTEASYAVWGVFVKNETQFPSNFEVIRGGNGLEEGDTYIGNITVRGESWLKGSTATVAFAGLAYNDPSCIPQSQVYFSAPTANNNDPTRAFAEKAILKDTQVEGAMNATFKRITDNGVFAGVEITAGGK